MTVVALAIALVGGPAFALPLDPDPTFGDHGVVRLGSPPEQPTPQSGTSTRALLLQPDGRILALVDGLTSEGGGLWRLNADGGVDDTFANGTALGTLNRAAIALQTDGRIIVSGPDESIQRPRLMRLLPDGTLDASFGDHGSLIIDFASIGVIIQDDGRLVLVGSSSRFSEDPSQSGEFLALVRLLPDGKTDLDFGVNGVMSSQVRGHPVALAKLSGGAWLVAASELPDSTGTIVTRFRPDGQVDATFASGGTYRDESPTAIAAKALAVQADGGVSIAGNLTQGQFSALAVMRLDASGNRDYGFGLGGQATLQTSPGDASSGSAIAVDSHGRIVVVGTLGDLSESSDGFRRIAVMRLNPDGSPDTFFAPHGTATVWDGYSSVGVSMAIDSVARILVGGTRETAPYFIHGNPSGSAVFGRTPQAAVFRLQGGDSLVPFTFETARAVEYYYAGFGHYFVTVDPLEIAHVDTFLGQSWVRTGQWFRVWSEPSAGLSGVCRFFSGQFFAPKSSHFYTPYPAECAWLKTGGIWAYEGDVFALQLPQGPPGQGNCAAGALPLYRLYNNGMGGAPNHRYTTDLATLDAMLQQGWSFEGEAATKIFACVPQ